MNLILSNQFCEEYKNKKEILHKGDIVIYKDIDTKRWENYIVIGKVVYTSAIKSDKVRILAIKSFGNDNLNMISDYGYVITKKMIMYKIIDFELFLENNSEHFI